MLLNETVDTITTGRGGHSCFNTVVMFTSVEFILCDLCMTYTLEGVLSFKQSQTNVSILKQLAEFDCAFLKRLSCQVVSYI